MCMKRNAVRSDLLLVLCGILVWLLADAEQVRAATAEGLRLCGQTVVPALFPFLVVSGLLISLGLGEWLSPHLAGWMGPLFHLPGSAGSALLLGLIGGYPIGARTAAELYREGLLTREETQRLLAFCSNSNPVFLISVLGAGVFHDVRTGVYLWLIHIASALLTGILFRGGRSPARRRETREFPCRTVTAAGAFVGAVQGALSGMLSVCAFVTLFYVLVAPLKSLPAPWGTALVGVTELFSLTPLLTPDRSGFLLSAACVGWGGLSILCQTAAVLDGTGLRLGTYVKGKVVQSLLSLVLAWGVWTALL